MSGMTVTSPIINKAVKVEFDVQFLRANMGPYANYKMFVQDVDSTSAAETYAWWSNVNKMKEWKGPPDTTGLDLDDVVISNKEYESSINVKDSAIRDDVNKMLDNRIGDLAMAAARLPYESADEYLANGDTLLSWDEIEFFSDTGRVNDNIVTGSGITIANIETDITTAYGQMFGFENEKGQKLGITPGIILAGANLVPTIAKALGATGGGGTVQSFHLDWLKALISSPALTGTNKYILIADGTFPVIWQDRDAAEINVHNKRDVGNFWMYLAYRRGAISFKRYEAAILINN